MVVTALSFIFGGIPAFAATPVSTTNGLIDPATGYTYASTPGAKSVSKNLHKTKIHKKNKASKKSITKHLKKNPTHVSKHAPV